MFFTRRFILGASAAAVSFSAGLAASVFSTQSNSREAIQLRALLPAASARKIGSIYRASYSDEAGTDKLVRLILASVSPKTGSVDAMDQQALSTIVTSRVRADFEEGLTVNIGGWILSRTEARICALWA